VKSKEKKQGREFLEGGLRRGEVGESVSVSLPFSISDNTWGRHHLVIPLRSPTADGHFVIRAEKNKRVSNIGIIGMRTTHGAPPPSRYQI